MTPRFRSLSGAFALATLLTLTISHASALEVGDRAPAFKAIADSGKTWSSADVIGKKILVVYFYPADMTPGCTRQACAFRDDLGKLRSQHVEVVGISGDSVRNHQLFKKAYKLNFPLLADEEGLIAALFGVPTGPGGSVQRTIDGQLETLTRGVTARRHTFVIGLDGKIAAVNRKVNAARDSQDVQAIVRRLSGGLEPGDRAPVFTAPDDRGQPWRSADHVGKKVLVFYFYPADMTGGCTKQACAYRDDREAYARAGAEVIGISGDSVKNHQLFKKVHGLNFTLLADEKGEIARAFGVPSRKGGSIQREVDGEEFTLTRGHSAARWTFVVNREGKIAHVDRKVAAAADSKKVLEVIEKLAGAKKQ